MTTDLDGTAGRAMSDKHGPTPTRRSVVRLGATAAAAGLGVVGLAACGDDEPAGTDSAAPSASPSESAGSAATTVANLKDVPVGGMIVVGADAAALVISQPTAGKVIAFKAACTHKGCPVVVEAGTLICPCHGSTFDPVTGAATKAPATGGLQPVQVGIEGDSIITA